MNRVFAEGREDGEEERGHRVALILSLWLTGGALI
jgi:hypothetical protein